MTQYINKMNNISELIYEALSVESGDNKSEERQG